jgi:hypothetical protein
MKLLDSFKFALSPKFIAESLRFFGGGKGDSPDAPDYSEIAAANREAAQYAKQAADADLAFRKEQWQASLPRQNQLYDLAAQVAEQQMGLGRLTEEQARQQIDAYNATYRPMELQTVLDSLGSQYLSEEDVQSAIKYLTDPEYDVEDVMAKRQKATTTMTPETIETIMTENGTYAPVGLQNQWNGGASWANKGQRPATPQTTTKTTKTTSTTQKPVTTYTEEEYKAGEKKTLNKEYEAQRAFAIDQLAKKAQEGAALQAGERTQAQVNSATAQQTRALARMGLNPAKFQAIAADTAQRQALTNVNAQNAARTGVADKQIGLRTGVANFGRNMPNTAGTAVAGSTNAGNSAVGNQNTGVQGGLGYANYMSGGYAGQLGAAQLKQQGALGLGGLMNQGYQIGSQNANSGGDFLGGALGLVGSLGSAYLMAGSDRRIKENIQLVAEMPNGINLYAFEYKPEYKDTWGHGGFIGVMADEVEQVIPEAVGFHEDGYKVVDYSLVTFGENHG